MMHNLLLPFVPKFKLHHTFLRFLILWIESVNHREISCHHKRSIVSMARTIPTRSSCQILFVEEALAVLENQYGCFVDGA
jgi:cyclophilin family peptidyl-prolyl cis-trans isomerase